MPPLTMPPSTLPPSLAARCSVVALCLALAGCGSDGPVKGAFEIAGLATTAQESKPFVKETRPDDPAYVPVGRVFAERPLCKATPGPLQLAPATETNILGRTVAIERLPPEPCKPRAEFKSIETELESKRLANEAESARAKALGQALPPPKPPVIPPS